MEKEQLALQALTMYPDIVKLVYHHYPDDDFSYKLAESLEAAGEQDKFWEMHDRIMSDVPENIEEIINAAKEIEIGDIEKFAADLDSGVHTETVRDARVEAENHDVHDVSLFVNTREYQKYPGTIEDLIDLIDEELENLE